MKRLLVGLLIFATIIVCVAVLEASELRCRVCVRSWAIFADRRCHRHRLPRIRA